MAKFVFKYATLKKLRENKLLVARREMLDCEGKLRHIIDDHLKASTQRAELFDDRLGGANIPSLQLVGDLLQGQTQKMRQLEKQILTMQGEVERHRNWVAHLGREVKIVEKIEEKQRRSFEDAERSKEKRESDRWVSERWASQMANGTKD